MRILYLSPTEPYPGTHAGFTHVHNLLKNLCRSGIEVTLIAGEPEAGVGGGKKGGIRNRGGGGEGGGEGGFRWGE